MSTPTFYYCEPCKLFSAGYTCPQCKKGNCHSPTCLVPYHVNTVIHNTLHQLRGSIGGVIEEMKQKGEDETRLGHHRAAVRCQEAAEIIQGILDFAEQYEKDITRPPQGGS